MIISALKERKDSEKRVAIVPDVAKKLVNDGHKVLIESGAGEQSFFSDASYIESGAGVKEGGRTGLTAVAVAVLFAICLFLAPLAQSIPAFATAPALVFVATFFLKNLRDIEWDDVSEYAPAVLAAVLMPLTFSIAHGIALGFIAYVVIKALSGRHEDLNAGSIVIGVLSVLYFIF